MRYSEFHYRWEWHLKGSPEALWPFVTDTNRINQDAGVPPITQQAGPGRRLRLTRLGMTIEWEEEPFKWVRPHRFGMIRRYTRGPVAEVRVLGDLTPGPDGGTRLIYQIWARPKSALGLVAIPVQIGLLGGRAFSAAFRHCDEQLAEGEMTRTSGGVHVKFAPGGRERLRALHDALVKQGAAPDLVARLIAAIEHVHDCDAAKFRPYALADQWRVHRRSVLELFLLATRAGLLDLCWEVLCPLCRGATEENSSLRTLDARAHCANCNFDFTANFDRLVEVTFRPNPTVREIDDATYCVGAPQLPPHIVAQQLLRPGEVRALALPLREGRYRLRTATLHGERILSVVPEGQAEVTFRASESGWPAEELRLSAHPTIHLENPTRSEQIFILEETAWSDQILTAADIIMLQMFRDLFASEVLRPGETISVGSVTILFTDLRGSTRLYRQIGDAPACGRVLDHFAVLREAVAQENGTVVKTIGDAIMAAFRSPASALRAIIHAQEVLASPTEPHAESAPPLVLKAGIHYGPCITVTFNDHLDYFGSTVNIAARLERLSLGGDVVISSIVRSDPEVAAFLHRQDSNLSTQPFEAMLTGFDEESFELWRVAPVSAEVQRQPIAGR